MQKTGLYIIMLSAFFFSCGKETITDPCGMLKDGIVTNDIGKVKTAMNLFIAALQDMDYNESNIHTLSQRISGCGFTAEPFCFDCIQTLPSQTEIRIAVNSAGVQVSKIIDLSYTSTNKIVFHNMHN